MIVIRFWHSRPRDDDKHDTLLPLLKRFAEDHGNHFEFHNGSLDAFNKNYGRPFLVYPDECGELSVYVTQHNSFGAR